MKIAEIFYSIQGEGVLTGVPSVFVRTSGCNLRCSWCDTPYTSWKPEGTEMSNDVILDEVAKYSARHVVLTGGEPMLFAPAVPLTNALRERGMHITVETAGTVYQPVACDLMSISPKLANSTPEGEWSARHEAVRYQPAILTRLTREYDHQLKFVVSSPQDLDEIQRILTELNADRARVILMPEGTTPEVTRERAQWLAEVCKREGFRYSPRLHVDIWGDKRGV
jgi:7-carboxy-7-deazaguanine synthase